jgi:hypothetical protein
MLQLFGAYLAVVGGVAAGAQVARGAVRGAARLAHGDGRGALVEVAGGLAAPVFSAVHELSRLAVEVCLSATALTTDVRHRFVPATARSESCTAQCRRGATSSAEANGAVPAANGAAA